MIDPTQGQVTRGSPTHATPASQAKPACVPSRHDDAPRGGTLREPVHRINHPAVSRGRAGP
eukprot:8459839-Pyramimonas_sp.AAC.1